MIHQSDLKARNLDSLKDFFIHIVQNYANGNHKDVKKFIKQLSKPQKLEFHYFLQNVESEETKTVLSNVLIESVLNPDF